MAAAGAMAVALSGCGEPEFHYPKNSEQHVYFKVPSTWQQIDGVDPLDQLEPVEPSSGAAQVRESRRVWEVAYDTRTDDVDNMHLPLFDNMGQPLVYAKVWALTEAERNQASLDFLRDLVLPVSETGVEAMITREQQIRQALTQGQITAEQAEQLTSNLSGYELLGDQVLNPGGGIKGVRSIYHYSYDGGPLYTYDQTAYLSADLQYVYILIISSSARQYDERRAELDGIATSFTVRSP